MLIEMNTDMTMPVFFFFFRWAYPLPSDKLGLPRWKCSPRALFHADFIPHGTEMVTTVGVIYSTNAAVLASIVQPLQC